MNVSCPSCSADNVVDKLGQEAVCVQCFNVWTVEENSGDQGASSVEDSTLFEGDSLSSGGAETVAMPMDTSDPFGAAPAETTDPGVAPPAAMADPFAAPPAETADPFGAAGAETTDPGVPPPAATADPFAAIPDDIATAGTTVGMALGPSTEAPDATAPTVAMTQSSGGEPAAAEPSQPESTFTSTGLFGRPRRSSLSKDDLSGIGGRKPSSGHTEADGDTIWGPDAPAPRTASDALWDAEKKAQPTAAYSDSGASDPGPTDFGGAEASSGGSSMDDPFADLGGDSSSSLDADPFADVGTAAPADDDPFASADFGTDAPAAAPDGGGDAEGLEEVGFDTLEFEHIEASEFDETLKGNDVPDLDDLDDSMFELDVSDDELLGDDDDDDDSRRGRRGRGRRSRKKRSMGAKIAAVLVTVVVLAGVGLGQTNMGYFGINLIMGSPTNKAKLRPQRPPPKPGAGAAEAPVAEEPTISASSLPAYLALVTDLEAKHEGAPTDTAIANSLADVLLTVHERYPTTYQGNPAYAATMEQLLTAEGIQLQNRHKIRNWLLMGKVEDAKTAAKLFETSSKVEDLHLLGRLAEASNDPKTAGERYEKAVGVKADYEPALRDLARLHLSQHNLVKARGVYEALIKQDPNHAEAKLALIRITIFEKNFPEAGQKIDAMLNQAKEAENVPDQFQAFKLKADLAEARGKLDERAYALERALELQPGDVETATTLAHSLRKEGKLKDALDRLKACADAGCTSPTFIETYVNTLHSAGEVEKAEEKLTAGLETFPKASNLLLLQASRKLQDGHPKTAKQLYATIMENTPEVVEAHLAFARILVDEKRYDEAIETLGNGAAKSGDKLTLLAEMAEIQMKSGYILKAKETMGKILTIDPGNLKIKLRFAKLLMELRHFDESAGYYKDLQEAGSLKGTELLDYALVLETMGRLEESGRFAEQVLKKDPQNLKANILMGSLQVRRKEFDAAKEVLERALSIDNNNARAHFYLGVNQLNQGNSVEATKLLVQAKSLDQQDLEIRFQLAEALAQSGGKGESRRLALNELDYIVSIYKKYSEGLDKIRPDPEVYLRRGQLHFLGNDLGKALADFKTAMQIDSSRQDVILEFATTLRTRGRHDDAAPYFKEVLRGDPRNATAHYNLARIAMKKKNMDAAEKHFKKATTTGAAQFPDAHRYLAYLYKDRSLKVPACSNFKAYLKQDHKNPDREEIARLIKGYCR